MFFTFSFIAASAAGVALECETVDLGAHTTASGADFYAVNPKGNVPTLVLDNGVVLNEGAATLQWIADQNPDSVCPAAGTTERYQVIGALNYVASEVHSSFGPLFNPAAAEDVKTHCRNNIVKKLDYLEKEFATKSFLAGGEKFSIADLYLYIVLSWCPYVGATIDEHANVKAYFEKMAGLPEVVAAHARMGTAPATTA